MDAVAVADSIHQTDDTVADADVAARYAATILITALTAPDVERLARSVHAASTRAASPFIQVTASALPNRVDLLTETCASLIDAAAGGTLMLMEVTDMPPIVQDRLIETVARLQRARAPLPPARLIAGTTADVRGCIAAGTFSEHLFYRLNIIHLVVRRSAGGNGASPSDALARAV